MKDFKLTKILQSLNKSEMKNFSEMLSSVYFNKNEKMDKLLQFYHKHHPLYNQKSFSIQNANQFVLGVKSNEKEALTKLSSKLLKLFEKFLVTESDDQQDQDLTLAKFYFHRSHNNFFNNKIKQIEKNTLKNEFKNTKDLQFQIELKLLKRNALIQRNDSGKGDALLIEIDDLLEEKQQLEKIKHILFKYNRASIVKFDFNHSGEAEVVEYAKEKQKSNINFKLWLAFYEAFNLNNKPAIYKKLKSITINNFEKLSQTDKFYTNSMLHNLSRRHLGTGHEYYIEVFDIYKFRYKTNTLNEQKVIYSATVMNIIRLGIYLKEFEFIDRFLYEIKDNIAYEENEKEDIFEYANVHILFSKGKFEVALELLNSVKLHNIFLKLEEKRIRLLIYFKLKMFEIVDDSINSLRKFLSVNKNVLTDFQLEANRNFLSIYAALIKLRKNDKRKINKLKDDIEQTKSLPFRSWFIKELS